MLEGFFAEFFKFDSVNKATTYGAGMHENILYRIISRVRRLLSGSLGYLRQPRLLVAGQPRFPYVPFPYRSCTLLLSIFDSEVM